MAAVFALTGAGCGGGGGDTTALVVLVEDCAGLATGLARVRVRIEADGTERASHDFALQGAGATPLPFSFAIAPGDGGANERLTVIVEGYTAADDTTPAVRYIATDTGFLDGQTLLLDVCLDTDRTEARPPSSLRVIDPGAELDASVMDADTPPQDAGTDTGTPPQDAGTDTGTPPQDAGTDTGTPPQDAGEDASVPCGTACPDTIAITAPGGRFTPSVSGASAHTGSCGGAGGPEQAYAFTLTEPSDVFISTHHSSVDTVVYVRACHCDGQELGCSDGADGRSTSALQLPNLQPGSYHAFVDTKTPMSATIPVDIHITPASEAGNRCGRPTPLTSSPVSGDTCPLTNDHTYTACDDGFAASFNGHDQVYYVIVDSTRSMTFDTCAGADYDTSLLLSRTCLVQDVLDCNDDSNCGSGPQTPRSRITHTLEPGLYYLWVDGYRAAMSTDYCGNYTLTTSGL
jgi:hypothetical protein